MQQQFAILRALGLSFRAWFRNFVPITALTAILYAPVVIWVATTDFAEARTVDELLDRVFTWPGYALTALSTLLAPMLTYRVVQDLNGTRVSMLSSVRHGLRGVVPALLLAVIVNLLSIIPGGGLVAAIVTCVYFVAAPAAVAERLGPGAAFRRSAELTRGRRWGIFGISLLIAIVVIGMTIAWIIPMSKTGELFVDLRQTALIFVVVVGVLQMFTGIVAAVTYALLRKDKDGVSHEQLARIFE